MGFYGYTLVCFLLASRVGGYPSFQKLIPNGNKIPHPCDTKQIWTGVGHEFVAGQGPLNPFGKSFLANNKTWTTALCKLDSDGDGKTNGEELGDPNCQWTSSGQTSPFSAALTHPGICEPITNPKCRATNRFLEKIDICGKALNLTTKSWCPSLKAEEEDVKVFDMNFTNTTLPNHQDTIYLCQRFSVPSDRTYQIIAWEPLIDNQELMHHAVIFFCNDGSDESELRKNTSYMREPEQCGMTPRICGNSAFVWSFGQPNRCYGQEMGVQMGNGSFRYVVMQIHYNNPSLYDNVTVASGFRLYYTARRRDLSAGMFHFAQLDFLIPPNTPRTVIKAKPFTTTSCSKIVLGTEPRHMISLLFHMHKMGTHAKLILLKKSGEAYVIVDEDVTYDRPKFLVWSTIYEAPVLEAGDNLEMECTFNSTGKKEYTFFGERTVDEMCMAFIELVPQIKNTFFTSFNNFIDKNACMWIDDSPSKSLPYASSAPYAPEIYGCSLSDFSSQLNSLKNSREGGLAVHCPAPDVFPATNCSSKCYTFLTYNMLTFDNPCMESATFRLMTAFSEYHSMQEVYYAQSEIGYCLEYGPTD